MLDRKSHFIVVFIVAVAVVVVVAVAVMVVVVAGVEGFVETVFKNALKRVIK